MKLYPEDMGGGGGEGGTADAGAAAGGAGASAAPAAGGAPAPKTYTQDQMDAYAQRQIAARDGEWNRHLFDPEKGKAALQTLAAQHGMVLTEKEKEKVADAAATGDDSALTPREKAMLERLEKLEGKDKAATVTAAEQQATDAMQKDISRAARTIPYGRDPKLNGLVEDLIIAAMIDPKTERGTPTANIAKGIQFALEAVLAEWVKDNGYIKDPSIAAGQPLRGGVSQSAVKPTEDPKNFGDVEAQTVAMIRAMRSRK